MGIERRQTERLRVSLQGVLHVGGGGQAFMTKTWDLSLLGVFLLLPQALPVGARVSLSLCLDDNSDTLFLPGVLVHVAQGHGVGIRFTALSPRMSNKLAIWLEDLTAKALLTTEA